MNLLVNAGAASQFRKAYNFYRNPELIFANQYNNELAGISPLAGNSSVDRIKFTSRFDDSLADELTIDRIELMNSLLKEVEFSLIEAWSNLTKIGLKPQFISNNRKFITIHD